MYYQSNAPLGLLSPLQNQWVWPGDVVSVQHKNFVHWGIRTGPNTIIAGSKRFKRVCEVSGDVFAGGGVINNHPLNGMFDRDAIVRAARSRLGDRYDLVFSNCEHFVTWVIHGKPESPQVKYWVSTIVAVAAIGLTAAAIMRQT